MSECFKENVSQKTTTVNIRSKAHYFFMRVLRQHAEFMHEKIGCFCTNVYVKKTQNDYDKSKYGYTIVS